MKKLVVSGLMALIIVAASVGVAHAQKESSKSKKDVTYVAAEQATFKPSPMGGVSIDVTGDFCTRWNERESTWRKSWSCRSRGTKQSRS